MSDKNTHSGGDDAAIHFHEAWLNADEWTLVWQSGGIHEFSRTGIYPEIIVFENEKIPFRSRRRISSTKPVGDVRKSRRLFFHFQIKKAYCEMFFYDDPQKRVLRLPVAHVLVD